MPGLQKLMLKDHTSLGVGGIASSARFVSSADEALSLLENGEKPQFILGYGSNSLVSDDGLDGTVWLMHGGEIRIEDSLLIADAGCWWDDVVLYAIEHELWGLELTSAIPGSVGAAVVGNIAAYGQAVSDTLVWAEVYDCATKKKRKISNNDFVFGYRQSYLQKPENCTLMVLRAAFELSGTRTKDVTYQTIVTTANTQNIDLTSLSGRRAATLATREKADSLYDFRHPELYPKTAGSFFRNPEVDRKTAEHVMSFDETGLSLERLKAMNQIHSGGHRVLAAHVLLAAGFHRGQTWGEVQLNKDHVLKIENIGNANAQDIFDVAMEIIVTVKEKLDIELVPEVRFLGNFDKTNVG